MVTNDRLKRCAPDERRDHIVSVATEAFTRTGYGSTSMSAIAARLGGSKATLYKYFPSKESLFEAVLRRGCDGVIEALAALAESASGDLEALLTRFGTEFLSALCTDRALTVYRMVHSAALRFPETAEMFFRAGPDRGGIVLAALLERHAALHGIALDDPRLAADQFLGMVRGKLHMRVALGLVPPPDAAQLQHHSAHAARIFARGLMGDAATAPN